MIRHPKILKREQTALLIIDVQERILGVMQEKERLMQNLNKLINGCGILNVPICYTEQYPKGLGETASELKEVLGENEAVQKMSFSCYGAEDLFEELKENGVSQVVAAGIESHVCVQQTVLDLLANGFQVNVPADAVSSRKVLDYETALKRMAANGAEVTSTESVLFELLEVCGTDEFKQVAKLVK